MKSFSLVHPSRQTFTSLAFLVLALACVPSCVTRSPSSQAFGGAKRPLLPFKRSQSTPQSFSFEKFAEEVPRSRPEIVGRVAPAQVALADYGLIRADVPELKGRSEEEIDRWLIDNFGYFSKTHFEKESRLPPGEKLHEPIPWAKDTREKTVLRPPQYGRALIIPATIPPRSKREAPATLPHGSSPVFDVKGVGTVNFETKSRYHDNGLMHFSQAIREYHFQKLLSILSFHSQLPLQLNPVYAVIHLGFLGHYDAGVKMSSAAIVRRATPRKGTDTTEGGLPIVHHPGTWTAKKRFVAQLQEVELTWRKYGITSATTRDTKPGHSIDFINLQFTRDMQLIDFGSYSVKPNFQNELYIYPPAKTEGEDRATVIVGYPAAVIKPEHEKFVETAHPRHRVPSSVWGIHSAIQAIVDKLPPDLKPDGSTNFIDTPSLAGVWLGDAMHKGQAQKSDAQEQHCLLLLPVITALGLQAKDFSSTQNCEQRQLPEAVKEGVTQACSFLRPFLEQAISADDLDAIEDGCIEAKTQREISAALLAAQAVQGLGKFGNIETALQVLKSWMLTPLPEEAD